MATETQIRNILADPYAHDWTIQGFGMLRLWLDPEGHERLHIWDQEQANENVSTLHNHPWDFDSTIVFGRLTNQRYEVFEHCSDSFPHTHYQASTIITGQGGYLLGDPFTLRAREKDAESYSAGDSYHQDAPEFHESYPDRGTVTVITRKFRFDRHATVGWSHGTDWVSAEPRPATRDEIDRFIGAVKL